MKNFTFVVLFACLICRSGATNLPTPEKIAQDVAQLCKSKEEKNSRDMGLARHDLKFEVVKIGDQTSIISALGTPTPAWPVQIKYEGSVTMGWEGPISHPETKMLKGTYDFFLIQVAKNDIGLAFDVDLFGSQLAKNWMQAPAAPTPDRTKAIAEALEIGPQSKSGTGTNGAWTIRAFPRTSGGGWYVVMLWKKWPLYNPAAMPQINGGFYALMDGEDVLTFDDLIKKAQADDWKFGMQTGPLKGYDFGTALNSEHQIVLTDAYQKFMVGLPGRFETLMKQTEEQHLTGFEKDMQDPDTRRFGGVGKFVVDGEGKTGLKTRMGGKWCIFTSDDIKQMKEVPTIVKELANEQLNQQVAEVLSREEELKKAKSKAESIK